MFEILPGLCSFMIAKTLKYVIHVENYLCTVSIVQA